MRTMCSREIFKKKCQKKQIFDSDLKGAWHYSHVTFTPIAKIVMLYCRLICMLSILRVRLTIKVKVGIPESFKVGWYPPKKTGSSHLNSVFVFFYSFSRLFQIASFVKCWRTLPEGLKPCSGPPRQGNVKKTNIHKKGRFMGKLIMRACLYLIHPTW